MLLKPAIDYAENGVLVRPHMIYYWNVDKGSGRVPLI